MDRLEQHALNTKCQTLCLVFYIFYNSTVIATHEIIITFYILGNGNKERSRKLHKVTQVETGLYLIPKPILLTITILKKLSHHQDHCALSKDKHYLRRMVCLESRQEKHEHFRVVSPQPREGDSSHSWPEQSGLPRGYIPGVGLGCRSLRTLLTPANSLSDCRHPDNLGVSVSQINFTKEKRHTDQQVF